MDRNRTVADLDVHKDSIYLCIMGHDEAIIFEKTYGVLTRDLRQMCDDMLNRGLPTQEKRLPGTIVFIMGLCKQLYLYDSIRPKGKILILEYIA